MRPMGTQASIAGLPVYVISLADAEVRRANMTARLGALGIPFQFVDAIDGRRGRLPAVFDASEVDPSQSACTLSHRKVHSHIVRRVHKL